MSEKTKSGFGSMLKFTMTLAVSAAAGFAAGVLFAPKSGKETREDVKDISLKLKQDANTYANEMKHRGEDMLRNGADSLKVGKKQLEDNIHEFTSNLSEQPSPVEQIVAKVKKVGNDSKAALSEATKTLKKEPSAKKELENSDEFSTDSLLARIQGITADSLED